MITQTYIPRFPLNKFVEIIVHNEGYVPSHAIDRFLPDGNTEIIIDFDDRPKFIYDNHTFKELQACHHVWASGVRTECISIPSANESAMVIISFKKGRAYPFFPVPMSELSDCVVDADLLWGNDFAFLRERLMELRDAALRFALVEDFLLGKFRSSLVSNPCVEFAVNEIIQRPDQISLASLNAKVGYSQKHFIEMFKRHVGITPKAYLKIMRFQKAINEIEQRSDIEWTGISQDCGFYDQAHFINDFKSFSGFTPEEYVKRKSDILNYVPVA